MKRSGGYHTKQRDAILSLIASLGGRHVTAAELCAYFAASGQTMGRATIYRHLERLTEEGKLRKYSPDGTRGACYQQNDRHEDCHEHFHLKCEQCGELVHLQCDALNEIGKHMLNRHAFRLNGAKTVLYGLCGQCGGSPDSGKKEQTD